MPRVRASRDDLPENLNNAYAHYDKLKTMMCNEELTVESLSVQLAGSTRFREETYAMTIIKLSLPGIRGLRPRIPFFWGNFRKFAEK